MKAWGDFTLGLDFNTFDVLRLGSMQKCTFSTVTGVAECVRNTEHQISFGNYAGKLSLMQMFLERPKTLRSIEDCQ
jgi:hypothetical protein